MVALEYEMVYVYQAIAVNTHLMQQLANDLPLYAASDWNAKTIPFINSLQAAITKLDEYCKLICAEFCEEQLDEVMRVVTFDMRNLLANIRGYCCLLEMFITPQDAALVTLEAIEAYAQDTYEISHILFNMNEKRDK